MVVQSVGGCKCRVRRIEARSLVQKVRYRADSAGRALIAWTESNMGIGSGTDDIHVRRAEGGTIVPLGSGVFDADDGDSNVNLPSLAVDLRDRVVLAFSEETSGGGRAIRVKRYRDATSP